MCVWRGDFTSLIIYHITHTHSHTHARTWLSSMLLLRLSKAFILRSRWARCLSPSTASCFLRRSSVFLRNFLPSSWANLACSSATLICSSCSIREVWCSLEEEGEGGREVRAVTDEGDKLLDKVTLDTVDIKSAYII